MVQFAVIMVLLKMLGSESLWCFAYSLLEIFDKVGWVGKIESKGNLADVLIGVYKITLCFQYHLFNDQLTG